MPSSSFTASPNASSAILRRFAEVARSVGRPVHSAVAPSAWLSTLDLVDLLRLGDRRRPREAALDWALRKGLASARVNREYRFSRRDVQRVLDQDMVRASRCHSSQRSRRAG